MPYQVLSAKFVAGASDAAKLPRSPLPEIAVLGRSNVGKSTFVNKLAAAKSLARTSSTPGRTKQINLFELIISGERGKKFGIMLADLPGFGFAKISKAERESLAKLSVDYISGREETRVIILLNDCRREPEDDELAVRKLAFDFGKPCLIVLTKTDKLKRGELERAKSEVAAAYGLEPGDVLLSGEGLPAEPVWARVAGLI